MTTVLKPLIQLPDILLVLEHDSSMLRLNAVVPDHGPITLAFFTGGALEMMPMSRVEQELLKDYLLFDDLGSSAFVKVNF